MPDGINEMDGMVGASSHRMIRRALSEIIYSVALEEKAISELISAEAEKIRAAVEMEDITVEQLLCLNTSVENTLESITRLETFLLAKLKAALGNRTECCSQ